MRLMICRYFHIGLIAVLLVLLGRPGLAASTGERLALVIGNGAYSSIGSLPNPAADARLIAATLIELGFDTAVSLDANQIDMKRQIAEFGRNLRSASKDAVGFFYYAGHGIQASGRNYLLPVEATPSDQADLDLMGVEANWVLRQMESAGNRTNIIVLDACRNNPFVASNRSLGRGLAQVDAPTGSFISYATAPGKVALDGESVNSPFTTALANALKVPGIPVEQVFKRVRVDVIKATNGGQIPWDSSSLVDDFIMRPIDDPKPEPLAAPEQMPIASGRELSLWESVSASANPDKISMFLQIYPDSALAPQARALLIEALMAPSTAEKAESIPDASISKPDPLPADRTEENTIAMLSDSQRQLQELDMINAAQSSANVADYEEYLKVFPTGTFVDLAKAEIESLLASTSTDGPVTAEYLELKEPEPAAESAPETEIATDRSILSIDTPLPESAQLTGEAQSISQLVKGSPVYPPFEGLEEDYWKNEKCSNCHTWDKPSLCKQGEFYVGLPDEVLDRIKHPYGGFFKSALKVWAASKCS
jgi:uncharacterized caspase-like protein